MDTSVHNPPCFTLFDPVVAECAACGIQADCMKAQEKLFQSQCPDNADQKASTQESIRQPPSPKRKEKIAKNHVKQAGGDQNIPEHSRKPLVIPPVGSKIQTTFRGQTYEAVIVDDPSNKRTDGRSILFNGTVYRTLTAAAHAISPGINSGSVWQEA